MNGACGAGTELNFELGHEWRGYVSGIQGCRGILAWGAGIPSAVFVIG